MKTYLPGGTHVSSHGFVNYMGAAPQPDAVFRDFPDAVIVDGDDDWFAPKIKRPQVLAEKAGITPLALFHTGISGITRSGVVLSEADYERLREYFTATYGSALESHNRIYRRK